MKTKNAVIYIIVICLITGCKVRYQTNTIATEKTKRQLSIVDERDNQEYGIVAINEQMWFTENLRFATPNSVCYYQRQDWCEKLGRLYPVADLAVACPEGWRVPRIQDWQKLKSYFANDSIYALLDTIHWEDTVNHTNESGLSIPGATYQMKKRVFVGEGVASTIWLDQHNKYDEYYHVHLYGGEGITFEQSNYTTNEVFHAHPIEDLANRRFSIRCMCDKG